MNKAGVRRSETPARCFGAICSPGAHRPQPREEKGADAGKPTYNERRNPDGHVVLKPPVFCSQCFSRIATGRLDSRYVVIQSGSASWCPPYAQKAPHLYHGCRENSPKRGLALGFGVSRAYDPHADVLSAWTTRFGAANSTPVVGYDYTYDKAWRRDSAKLSGTAFEGELGGQT